MANKRLRKKRGLVAANIAEAARLFGRMGGKARAARQTPKERQEIARQAAEARWSRVRAAKKGRGEA